MMHYIHTLSLSSMDLCSSEIQSSAGRLYSAIMTASSVLIGVAAMPVLALAPLPLFLEETAADRGTVVMVGVLSSD